MTTLYAGLFRLDVDAGPALALHPTAALAWFAVLGWSLHRRWPPAQQLAVALFATMFLTPYAYDYDVGMAGVALALIAADLRRHGSAVQLVLICLLLWVAGTSGAVMTDLFLQGADAEAVSRKLPALGGLALHLQAIMALWIIRRRSAPAPSR